MKYLGYEIEITQDHFPDSPREWDEVSTLVTAHRYHKGDEELPSDCADIEEAFEQHLEGEGLTMEQVYYHKVYLYEHSGVSVSTTPYGDRWDSGVWGYIYVSIEDAEQNFMSIKKEDLEKEALAYMNTQIKALDRYYNGDIYELHIPLLDENSTGYSSEEEALKEAKAYIDNADPKGEVMKDATRIYESCLDAFWDEFNKQKESLYFDDDGIQNGDKEELLTNIVSYKLRKY